MFNSTSNCECSNQFGTVPARLEGDLPEQVAQKLSLKFTLPKASYSYVSVCRS
jgi:hypothetical protein